MTSPKKSEWGFKTSGVRDQNTLLAVILTAPKSLDSFEYLSQETLRLVLRSTSNIHHHLGRDEPPFIISCH